MNKQAEQIILVNPQDKKLGFIEKLTAHRFGMLHRAFSVFIFRIRNHRLEVLLQQRSKAKYHGGGLWTNTCCSHPHPKEKIKQSAERRLFDEMGIHAKLKYLDKFHYIAKFNNGMTENEIDHVFVGDYNNDKININPNEVESYKWVTIPQLERGLSTRQKMYTPWLQQALTIAIQEYPAKLIRR
ncbi:MAG: isopentenyl-diphosphate Delta-isomerase [Gammaproteobacteria bacterium]|nr:isopentenyl-diphosphate Delta-isomerase [Gammaproteobacteria bacterium]